MQSAMLILLKTFTQNRSENVSKNNQKLINEAIALKQNLFENLFVPVFKYL